MSKLESFFLLTYIKHPKRNLLRFSFVFMVLGILLSVMILSAGLNLFEGYESTLKSVLLDSFAHISIQTRSGEYLTATEAEEALNKLKTQKEIYSAFAYLSYSAMVQSEGSVRGAMIRAYKDNDTAAMPYLKYLEPGYRPLEEGSVYVGYYMAEELKKAVGDEIRVIYPQLDRISPLGLMPNEHSYKIAGIYRSGYYEYDRSVLIMETEDAQSLLLIDDRYTKLELRLHPSYIDDADLIGKRYASLLGVAYYSNPWTLTSESLFRLIRMEKWLIFIIFSFLVLIAGLNVVSAVITIIYDKKNEIAVLKTVGASQVSIKKLIFFRIALVGFASILMGQILGALLSWGIVHQNIYQLKGEVYFIDRLTISVSPFNQAMILLVSALLIVICILIPLKRIDRLQIIELLRNP